METQCPYCGAQGVDEAACEARYLEGQALEYSEGAYATVHHLSVPSFMLQHNRYSRHGWLLARELLRRFVEEGLTPEQARGEVPRDSGFKGASLTKGEKLAGVDQIAWSMTIADVRLDAAELYCADVRRWAAAVLSDSAALVEQA